MNLNVFRLFFKGVLIPIAGGPPLPVGNLTWRQLRIVRVVHRDCHQLNVLLIGDLPQKARNVGSLYVNPLVVHVGVSSLRCVLVGLELGQGVFSSLLLTKL